MNHAIVWASVPTSGAGMSRVGPRTFSILSMNDRATRWRSDGSSCSGVTSTPPLAPPNGISTIAVFQVMSSASARTSSMSTSGWKRIPPLYGPRAPLCWTRKPENTWMRSSESFTGICTRTSR